MTDTADNLPQPVRGLAARTPVPMPLDYARPTLNEPVQGNPWPKAYITVLIPAVGALLVLCDLFVLGLPGVMVAAGVFSLLVSPVLMFIGIIKLFECAASESAEHGMIRPAARRRLYALWLILLVELVTFLGLIVTTAGIM